MEFKLLKKDKQCAARLGIVSTARGDIQTPIFMPVATHGAMKPLTPAQITETGAQIILSNTYHLHLQPGEGLVKKAGGLHKFMAWDKPILTDSGGFQVFSLPNKRITEDGVFFRHEITGEEIYLDPAGATRIQQDLGADIIMAFDECIPYPCERSYAEQSTKKTIRWLKECQNAMTDNGQALFGIVQGSVYEDLRAMCAREMRKLDLPGYAIGGVSVGEGLELLKKVVSWTAPHLIAGGYSGKRGTRHRHVRLRHPDSLCPQRHAVHKARQDPPDQQKLQARFFPDRPILHMLRLPELHPGLPAPSVHRQRGDFGCSVRYPQCPFLPEHDGGDQRGYWKR